MKVGVVFPQQGIGTDPGAIREFAQTTQDLGYDHIVVTDHILGANTASRPNWRGPYSNKDSFYEPLVLLGHLASIAPKLEFATWVLVLPLRQTVLVAKQVATVDLLSRGKLRLGIGVGWNDVEFEAMGADFHNRGSRVEEQIEVMRALWTQESVTFKGRYHKITDAGLNPLPVQRPIPIWFGGRDDRVMKRAARMGAGWIPLMPPDDNARKTIAKFHECVRKEGRDPAEFGLDNWVSIAGLSPEQWAKQALAWKEIGGTHVCLNTMRAGLPSPQAHINAVRQFKEALKGVL